MLVERLIPVSDGIICLLQDDFRVPDSLSDKDVDVSLKDFGAILTVKGDEVALPSAILEHFENAEGTSIYFYTVSPYELIPEYRGSITLFRDEVLKVKGAWDYLSRSP
jgi:hypothetical protein